MKRRQFGIIGSGSWGTALAKILTDNGNTINWWVRNEKTKEQLSQRGHNSHYLPSARFNTTLLKLSSDIIEVIENSEVILIAIPSSFVVSALSTLPTTIFKHKTIVSAIKGILPERNILLNDFLKESFEVKLEDYVAVLGPCHAEEVAAEKLSYLTFSGVNKELTTEISTYFKTPYINTVLNPDIFGVQYASVLKNIYAVGAGMVHGLDYGDNFMSVFIANAADEMAGFLRKAGIMNAEVGYLDENKENPKSHQNYAASVYLGDLLVTCYSLHSRNRSFGNMIGKGYSVTAAKLEMTMVAEGYFASRCMFNINEIVGAKMPIATGVYNILWENKPAADVFENLEKLMV